MRILHVIPNLLKGGAQRLAIDICNELTKIDKVDCKLLVLSESKNDFNYCSSNIQIIYCKVKFKLSFFRRNIIEIDEYEKIVNEFNPEIIHSHLYFAELICHESPRKNIQYISHLHSNNLVFKKPLIKMFWNKELIYRYYERIRLKRKYYKSNKKHIAISKDTFNYFKDNISNQSKNIWILPNGINLERFKNTRSKTLNSKISLVTVGNLFANKDQIFLLDVVNYIKNKKYSISLNIVGDGPELRNITERVKFLKIEENVIISGQKDLVEEELKESNFYVHSSNSEGFGLTIVEAMAAGLPVISYNAKGNKDIIKNGVNGYLIEDKKANYFGEIIIELFNNKEKYQKVSSQALITSLEYDLTKYIKNLIAIYKTK